MKKDLPGIFAGNVDRNITNREYSVTNRTEVKEENNKKIELNINQKIKTIFSSPDYIYKADVLITTNDGEYTKRIIGKSGNNLITMDNELINIDTIKDIKKLQ